MFYENWAFDKEKSHVVTRRIEASGAKTWSRFDQQDNLLTPLLPGESQKRSHGIIFKIVEQLVMTWK
jgi:hypothetical protein